MELTFSPRRILSQLKGDFKKWLPVFVAAFFLVLAYHLIFVTEKGVCSAVVNFSYVGLEAGFDPDGNRFDADELRSAELIRQAAEAIGEPVTDEDAERIREAVSIQGDIPIDAYERVVTKRSIYGSDKLPTTEELGESSYFPSQYLVKLRYKDAGFSAPRGTAFLEELLSAYERFFYEEYGYNQSIERLFSSAQDENYDYVDAVEILQNRLSSFSAYLARLSDRDNTRFVSKTTGYSFPDLASAVDTLRTEDVQWINSYIVSNNITKDKENLTDYYQYKIEDAQRALAQQDARLSTLNGLIENYKKTNAIFPNLGNAAGDSDVSAYEFTQPSEMYDDLISQKIACQTRLSEINEEIALFQRRIERLRENESGGEVAVVETRLQTVYGKIDRLLEDVRATADEFFQTVELKRAFQVLSEPKQSGLILPTVKDSVYDLLVAEAALFGFYVLYALRNVRVRKRKPNPSDEIKELSAAN